MRNWPRETRIKAAVVLLVAVAALAMFIWGQDRGDDRIVISPGPPPTSTPLPGTPDVPRPPPVAP